MAGISQFDARLHDLLAPLDEEEQKLSERLVEIDQERDEVRTGLQRIKTLRHAAFPDTKPKRAAKGAGARTNHTRISEDRINEMESLLRERERLTVKEAMSVLGWSDVSVRAALEILRDREIARDAGKAPGGRGNAKLYAIMSSES